MTLKEVAQICATIRKATYAWRNESEKDFKETVKVWYECLKDMPFDMAMKSTTAYLRDKNYPPTVADVYKPYKEYLEQKKLFKRELINIYYRAISNYPCYEDTQEAQQEYMRILGDNPSPEKAIRFERDLIDYVRDLEMNDDYTPPLIEYLKGVKQIE